MRGSNAARSPSPTNTPASIVKNSASDGTSTSHHACGNSCACDSNSPQLGVGGGKLAGVGKALGKSIKDFKNEVKDDKAEEKSKEDKKDET